MRTFFSALLIAGFASTAGASTIHIGFDDVLPETGEGPVDDFYEDGFLFRGNIQSWGRGGDVHLDDSGTQFYPSIDISAPFSFAPRSITFFAAGQLGYLIVPCGPEGETCEIPYEAQDIAVSGYRGGVRVAYDIFTSGLDGGPGKIFFSDAFSGIDAFRFELTLENTPDNYECLGGPCTHMTVFEMELAAVPLPASGALMIGALAAGIALRRRR